MGIISSEAFLYREVFTDARRVFAEAGERVTFHIETGLLAFCEIPAVVL